MAAAAAPSWQSCLSLSHLSLAQKKKATTQLGADEDDDSAWLRENLQEQLHYSAPLPIQQRLVPVLTRHLQSSLPLDLSLTAPTGSGKTLCYLLPLLLYLVGQDKKHAMETTMLRGLVLVPTRALGQQVYREALRLTAKTNIKVVQLCDEGNSGSGHHAAANSIRAEGAQLVREVTTPSSSSDDKQKLYYSLADIIIATPQKLLRHLDYTEGFTLRHLKLCVVDEADQLLAVGNFANLISKIIRRQEEEVKQYYDSVELEAAAENNENKIASSSSSFLVPPRQPQPYPILQKIMCSATLTSRIARTSEMNLHNCQYYVLDSNGDVVDNNSSALTVAAAGNANNNKKKQKVSAAAAAAAGGTAFALPPKLQEHIILVETKYKPAALLKLVFELTRKISAAMWEKQQKSREARERLKLKQLEEEVNEKEGDKEEKEEEEEKKKEEGKHKKEDDQQYPTAHDVAAAGPSIVIFAGSAEDARIVGHFLANSGFANIIEFTILTQLAERQKALLGSGGKYNPHYNPDHHHQKGEEVDVAAIADLKSYLDETTYYFPLLLVATDALVRGIDIPQVGHVINYEAPRTLQSYIHRAGRTARALRCGHVHTLLNAKRHSNNTNNHNNNKAHQDGQKEKEETEYDMYQAKINPFISRTLPLRYERTFFKFEKEATSADSVNSDKQDAKAEDVATTDATTATATAAVVDEEEHEQEAKKEEAEEEDVTAPAEAEAEAEEEKEKVEQEEEKRGEEETPVATEDTKENTTSTKHLVDMKKKPFTVKWYIKEADAYMNASVLSLSDFWGSALQRKQTENSDNNNKNANVSSTSAAGAAASSHSTGSSGAAAAAAKKHHHHTNNNNSSNAQKKQQQQQRHGNPKRNREEGGQNHHKSKKQHKPEH